MTSDIQIKLNQLADARQNIEFATTMEESEFWADKIFKLESEIEISCSEVFLPGTARSLISKILSK